ncbi:methyl-accepting chemotaxis protein [Massilia endophytica]|nr:methyl-accepting chemotaxis protein [Massilia endophytica]
MKFLKNLTIRSSLILTFSLLGLLLLLLGAEGIAGMRASNASLNEVYSNQLASTIAMGAAKNSLARARFVLDRAVFHPDAPDAQEIAGTSTALLRDSDEAWQQYRKLPAGPEEDALADEVQRKRAAYVKDGLQALAQALHNRELDRIDALAVRKVPELFAAYNDAADRLAQLQVKLAREGYEDSQALYRRLFVISVAAMVLGAVVMVAACAALMRAIMRPLRQALRHFEAMADGDLSTRIEISRNDEMGTLLGGLQKMQQQLASTVLRVRDGAGSIASASTQIASGNLDLSSRTEQQASSLEETASSLEELTATVRQNADNARQANQLALSASEVAAQGGKLVAQVVDTMGDINTSSQRIVDIISVIDSIAFQTNILALNAAVEAARAGEQGRGFAVVASEVRNLAQRSAGAAKEIKELIGNAVQSAEAGTALVDKAGATMGDIVASVTRVTDIMGEIMSASEEQSAGIDQINRAVTEMDQATQQNAALVEEAAAAAATLQDQASTLEETVRIFKLAHAAGAAAARPALPALAH